MGGIFSLLSAVDFDDDVFSRQFFKGLAMRPFFEGVLSS